MPDLEIDVDGHVRCDGVYYGQVRRWQYGKAWEARTPDGELLVLPGRNTAFPSAVKAACALVEVAR